MPSVVASLVVIALTLLAGCASAPNQHNPAHSPAARHTPAEFSALDQAAQIDYIALHLHAALDTANAGDKRLDSHLSALSSAIQQYHRSHGWQATGALLTAINAQELTDAWCCAGRFRDQAKASSALMHAFPMDAQGNPGNRFGNISREIATRLAAPFNGGVRAFNRDMRAAAEKGDRLACELMTFEESGKSSSPSGFEPVSEPLARACAPYNDRAARIVEQYEALTDEAIEQAYQDYLRNLQEQAGRAMAACWAKGESLPDTIDSSVDRQARNIYRQRIKHIGKPHVQSRRVSLQDYVESRQAQEEQYNRDVRKIYGHDATPILVRIAGNRYCR